MDIKQIIVDPFREGDLGCVMRYLIEALPQCQGVKILENVWILRNW